MQAHPNELESALARAAADPAARPDFYRLLLESEIFVLGSVAGGGGEGRRTVAAGERLSLANWEKKDGTRVIPFFASLEALRLAIDEQQPFLTLPARVLFEMTQGTTLVLNPASGHAKEFLPDEIQALLATGLNRVPQGRVVQAPTQVLLGQPADHPAAMLSALAALLARHPSVRAAYLCLMQAPGQAEPSLVVGFEGDGDLGEAMRQAGSVAGDTAPPGIAVDFVEVLPGDAGISAYFRQSVQPFYQRGARAEPEQVQ